MLLPFHFIQFWYVDGIQTLILSWRNLLFLIEEDLAVGLMWRLIFVPLFHDHSFVGRILSLIFRILRILSGLVTMVAASIAVFLITMIWLALPLFLVLYFLNLLPFNDWLYLPVLAGNIFGLALFVHHLIYHPIKKTWQITSSKEIWKATRVKQNEVKLEILLQKSQVKKLLKVLELEDWKIPPSLSFDQSKLAEEAFMLAKKRAARHISVSDFFIAFLKTIPEFQPELVKNQITIEDFLRAQTFIEQTDQMWRKSYIWDEDFHTRHLKGTNRGWLGAPTPALDAISTDLTQQASYQYFEDFFGREEVVSQITAILSQDTDRNALLVGEPGVGKSTLVQFLAKKIISGDAPAVLAAKRMVKLESSKLLSNVNSEGDMAQKIKSAFEEVQQSGDVIVFIDEIHELGIGDASKSYNIYSLLTPYLESNTFQFIASTEPGNYARILEKEGSLVRLFHKVEVPEATVEETLSILKIRSIETLMTQGITTTFPALDYIAKKAKQYLHERKLPDSALYLYNECKTQTTAKVISSDTVKTVLSRQINMPLLELDQNQKQNLLHLEDAIHQRMIDQVQAVTAVADTLRRAATALREENRPIGSFLFVGPTGVGKTELAKILSEVYFGNNIDKSSSAYFGNNVDKSSSAYFVRFDMSEYQTSESVSRLIGTSDNPGELTEAIKNKPYCLILLDEFEKASPQILTLFLQILEDGRLTGGDGKTVDFTNTIIIATSNVGSLLIVDGLKANKSLEQINSEVRDELLKVMKPELVNRFDSVVIFKPLSQFDLEEIVQIKLKALKQKLLEQGYVVNFDKELIAELARQGFDPILGARPLRRLIQDKIESNLSKMMLEEKLQKGTTFILTSEIFKQY